jgi:hypothetical protein
MRLDLLRKVTRKDKKILGISFIFSFGFIIISIFMTPQNIDAQESSSATQNIPPSHTFQLNQNAHQDEITSNLPYYPGDPEHHLKIYETYGNMVIVHPGESYLSTAECGNNDVLIGGGVHTNHEFSNLTMENMPNGFQKNPNKWIVEGFVPQDGTTIEITSVAFCAIK